MTSPSSWESTTFTLLAMVEREIEELTVQRESLVKQRDALMDAMRIYKERLPTPALSATAEPARALTLTRADVTDKTQGTILRLLASRNNGVLVVREAVRLMGDAGVFANMKNASSMVYGVLKADPTFKRMAPGVYGLVGTGPDASVSTDGLVERVRRLRNQNPSITRAEATKALLADGYVFGDKRPALAVSGAWMNLERQRKHGTWADQPRLISMR